MLGVGFALRKSWPVTIGSAIDQIPDLRAGLVLRVRLAREQFRAGRKNAAVPGERCRFGRISLIVVHAAKFELPARLNHGFGARRIAFAGKLHENFIIGAAGESDGRLGQSECIDAALDGFERLVHHVLAHVRNHGRLHGQQIAGRFSRCRRRFHS